VIVVAVTYMLYESPAANGKHVIKKQLLCLGWNISCHW